MREVTVHEAEMQWLELIAAIEGGEEIAILRPGRPTIWMVPESPEGPATPDS